MTEQTPTRVVLFAIGPDDERAVAEFRWSPESGVVLEVIDHDDAWIAQRYFDEGVPLDAARRLVPRTDGPAFMRALTQPSRSTAMRFVDLSDASDER
jgi:hypothetical protein